jgi:hypothetical protein
MMDEFLVFSIYKLFGEKSSEVPSNSTSLQKVVYQVTSKGLQKLKNSTQSFSLEAFRIRKLKLDL